jgi:hypothetical protein
MASPSTIAESAKMVHRRETSQPPLPPMMNKSKSQDIKAKLERYKREREEMEQQRMKLRTKNSERAVSMDSLRGGQDSARNSNGDLTNTINHEHKVETPTDQKELTTYEKHN